MLATASIDFRIVFIKTFIGMETRAWSCNKFYCFTISLNKGIRKQIRLVKLIERYPVDVLIWQITILLMPLLLHCVPLFEYSECVCENTVKETKKGRSSNLNIMDRLKLFAKYYNNSIIKLQQFDRKYNERHICSYNLILKYNIFIKLHIY